MTEPNPSSYPYPPEDVLAELGRIGIAGARVEERFAFVLLALHHPAPVEELLKLPGKRLCDELRKRIDELYSGELSQTARALVDQAQQHLWGRHAALHSVWRVARRQFGPYPAGSELATRMGSGPGVDPFQPELHAFHPRTGDPGPETVEELRAIRLDLEAATDTLEHLRVVLASALFAGTPPGARQVLPIPAPFEAAATTKPSSRPGPSGPAGRR